MPRYEYKVVPAPTKGLKGKGVKGAEARFSHAIQELMNGLAGYGWEYQRAETLPSIERSGLTSSTTEWRNVLVFRRLREHDTETFAPELLPPPPEAEVPMPEAANPALKQSDGADETASHDAGKSAEDHTKPAHTDPDDGTDNGVEDTSDVADASNSLTALAAARKSTKSND